MKDLLIILGMIVATGVVGAYLYFYTPASLMHLPYVVSPTGTSPGSPEAPAPRPVAVSFTTITTGTHAGGVTARKNYLATDSAGLTKLWKLAFGTSSTTPTVDFTEQEVVGVFAGKKPTGGYAISVSKVEDTATARTLFVTITVPGPTCMVTESLTTPYTVIALPMSWLPLAHVDATSTTDCK
jgi:hypothetical protein